MKNVDFEESELDRLCQLYIEGQLSSFEEKLLREILCSIHQQSKTQQETLKIMNFERQIFRKEHRPSRRIWMGAAALILLITGLSAGMLMSHQSTEQKDVYVVWQNGRQLSDEEARDIAEEEERIDMELLRKVMREQRLMMRGTYATANSDVIE